MSELINGDFGTRLSQPLDEAAAPLHRAGNGSGHEMQSPNLRATSVAPASVLGRRVLAESDYFSVERSRFHRVRGGFLCLIGGHLPLPFVARNQSCSFSRCRNCGHDIVRLNGTWKPIPKGFRVVWRRSSGTAGAKPADLPAEERESVKLRDAEQRPEDAAEMPGRPPCAVTERGEAQLALEAVGALTLRQRQVLMGIFRGLQNKTIAFELGLSTRTVEAYRSTLMGKLGVRNTAQAVRLAAAAGFADAPHFPESDMSGQAIA